MGLLSKLDSRPGAALSKLVFAAAALVASARHKNIEHLVLTYNVLWFGAAVLWFAVMPRWSMDWMVPRGLDKEKRHLIKTVEACVRFLGGMNSGMLALSVMTLLARQASEPLFSKGPERRILFYGFAVGHFSQFFINIPGFVTRGSKRPLWPEPDTSMLCVFVIDLAMFALNFWAGRNAQDD